MNVKIKNPKKLEMKIRTNSQERCNLEGRMYGRLWSSFGEETHGEK
jgi:hypothetical protein